LGHAKVLGSHFSAFGALPERPQHPRGLGT
jgi:hypothetical protein